MQDVDACSTHHVEVLRLEDLLQLVDQPTEGCSAVEDLCAASSGPQEGCRGRLLGTAAGFLPQRTLIVRAKVFRIGYRILLERQPTPACLQVLLQQLQQCHR